MIQLTDTLVARGTAAFNETFKREVSELEVSQLPLQESLAQGSYASTKNMQVLINQITETPEAIQIRASLFYAGILPGCACSDDVAPDNEYTEYCEVLFEIDLQTAGSVVTLSA